MEQLKYENYLVVLVTKHLFLGTIDRALGIQSDEEEEEDEEGDSAGGKSPASPSLLHRLGLRRNREEGRKSSRL